MFIIEGFSFLILNWLWLFLIPLFLFTWVSVFHASFSQFSGNSWLSNILRMKQKKKKEWSTLQSWLEPLNICKALHIWLVALQSESSLIKLLDNVWFSKLTESFALELANSPENSPVSCLSLMPTSWEQYQDRTFRLIDGNIVLQ